MSRYRTIAASTSPVEEKSYPAQLAERCAEFALRYRRILELITTDIERNDTEKLSAHLEAERFALRKLRACARTLRNCGGDSVPLPAELADLAELQAALMRKLKQRSSVLREELKSGTLNSRKRRIFGGEAAFIDISC